jgi:virginiamycin B lyase
MAGTNRTMRRLIAILALGALSALLAGVLAQDASAARGAAKKPHITVKTLPAYGVSEEEAVLNSRINPHGSTGTYRFQWGRTKQYGHVVPEEAPEESFYAGDEGQEIEELLEGLRPGTVYHYRAVAYSHGHKFFGQDETLKTWPSHPEPRTPHAKSPGRAATIDGVFSTHFPRYFHGQTVALAPDGAPWFGVQSEEDPPTLATVRSKTLVRKPLSSKVSSGLTTGLSFDRSGNLWFGSDDGREVTIGRRAPDGSLSTFALPGTEIVTALAIDPAGQVWFVRSEYRHAAKVGWITPTGVLGEVALAPRSRPNSITIGPDGAAWFAEEEGGQIGRVDATGQIQLFPLGAGVEPRQLVTGPDGALWFTENGADGPHPASTDRIGRMSSAGEVTQFPLSFGFGTRALAVDPRGFLWFGTDEGEIASISPTGTLGGRGCIGYCGTPIISIAPTPDRSVWFAGGTPDCSGCSSSASGLNLVEGTLVGKVPPDGVRPPADVASESSPQPESPPHLTVKTRPAYGVEETEALLAGFINPHGQTATFRFQWGKTKRYGHVGYAPEQPVYAGYKGEEVEEFIDELKPGTIYHFRVIGYSHGKKFFGQDETFKTLPFHSRY